MATRIRSSFHLAKKTPDYSTKQSQRPTVDGNSSKYRELHCLMKQDVVWSGLVNHIETPEHPDRRVKDAYRKSHPSSKVNTSSKSTSDEKRHWNFQSLVLPSTHFQKKLNLVVTASNRAIQATLQIWLQQLPRRNDAPKKTCARPTKYNHLTKMRCKGIATLGLHLLSMPALCHSEYNDFALLFHKHPVENGSKEDTSWNLIYRAQRGNDKPSNTNH